ncbi:hypothetical protein ACQ4PT_044618 [Festuca glaucescens]
MAYDQAAFSVRGAAAVLNYPVDRVQESLRTLALGATGGSPVLALKRCHSIRKRSPNKVKRMRTAMAPTKMMKVDAAKPVTQEQQPQITASAAAVVELEDLGADYLEELLRGLSPTRPDLVPSLLVQLASCPALLSFFFAFLGLVANTKLRNAKTGGRRRRTACSSDSTNALLAAPSSSFAVSAQAMVALPITSCSSTANLR